MFDDTTITNIYNDLHLLLKYSYIKKNQLNY